MPDHPRPKASIGFWVLTLISFFAIVQPALWWGVGLIALRSHNDGMAGPGFFAAFSALFGWPLSVPFAFAAFKSRPQGSSFHEAVSLTLLGAALAVLGILVWLVVRA